MINRIEVDEFWADSTIIEAGDYIFVGYCMANEGKSIKENILSARRLHLILSGTVSNFR